MPFTDLALIVFDKCITVNEDEVHGTLVITSMVYNYEFIDDFGDPRLGKFGKFLLKKVLPTRSKSQLLNNSVVLKNGPEIIENGDIDLESLDREGTLESQEIASDRRRSTLETERLTDRRTTLAIELDLEPLVVESWGPKDFDKDNHTMALMVAS